MQLALAIAGAVGFVAFAHLCGRRPLRTEFSSPPKRALAAIALIAVLAVAVFLPGLQYGAVQDVDFGALDWSQAVLGQGLLLTFLAGWFALGRGLGTAPGGLGLRWPPRLAAVATGIRAGVVGWGAVVLVNLTLGVLLIGPGGPVGSAAAPPVVAWLADLPAMPKLGIIAVAMVAEEAFFRGFLQPRFGAAATNVLFALGHVNYGMPYLVVGVFTLSVVLGRTFARERDLLPCVIAHGVFDAIQLFVILPLVVAAIRGH